MNDLNHEYEANYRKEWNAMRELFKNAKGLDKIQITTKETRYSKKVRESK